MEDAIKRLGYAKQVQVVEAHDRRAALQVELLQLRLGIVHVVEVLDREAVLVLHAQAAALGYPECPYDALLDDFEPSERTSIFPIAPPPVVRSRRPDTQ